MSIYSAYQNPSALGGVININTPNQYFLLDGVQFIRLHQNPSDDDVNSNIFPNVLIGPFDNGTGASYGTSLHTKYLDSWWTSGFFGGNGVTDVKGRTLAHYGGSSGGGLPLQPKSYLFTKINDDDISYEVSKLHTRDIWDNNTGSLFTFHTSSTQNTNSKSYFYDIRKLTTEPSSSFSVSFGHYNGSGSYSGGGQTNDSPSRAIYSQHRLLCLDDDQTKFTISGSETDYIYIINFNRDTLKDKLDPGNWQLSLTELSGSTDLDVNFGDNVSVATGSTLYTLIDNSLDSDQTISEYYLDQDVYSVVNGTISNGIISNEEWGKVYPKMGIIILDGRVLDSKLSFGTSTGSNINGDNAYKLFTSISGSAVATTDRTTLYSFDARSSETITNNHYFIHIDSEQYNFSNNPTYTSGSNGDLLQQTFIDNPTVYISSIGLYNDNQDLLAIGKFSRAIRKNFNEELHVTLNLEY